MNTPTVRTFTRAGLTATLYLGDCLEILPTLRGIDAVITDPPYGINHKSSFDASWSGTEIAGDGCTKARDSVWNFYSNHPRAMFGISWMQPPPTGVRIAIIWDKGTSGCGDLKLPWKPSWEEIYIAGNGWAGRRDNGVLSGKSICTWETGPAHNGENGRKHPHEKPSWLMEHLIRKLPTAKTILDPFMGSGTTGIACLRTGRNFIGIEIDPKHYKTACDRIEQECRQGVLL